MEDRHKLFDWSNRMIGSEHPEYHVAEDDQTNAQLEMFLYASELAQQRRQTPRPDIVTTLLEAEVDGDRLSEMDFNLFFLLLSAAGNETIRNAIWYISANPFRFDVERTPNEHVAFDGGGPHFCLGASLARLEMRVLFEELVRRVPRVAATGPAERLRSNSIDGPEHMPVRLHAA